MSTGPEDFSIDDPFHVDRWMCSNCGLIFDYQFASEDGSFGWPFVEEALNNGGNEHEAIELREFCSRCRIPFDEIPPIPIRVSQMKNLNDILTLIQQGESQTLELKREFPQNEQNLRKTVAAFANTRGGRIILGVNDVGEIVGLAGIDTPEGKDACQQRVRDLIARIKPRVRIRMDFYSDDNGRRVAVITVPKGPEVYSIRSRVYVRELEQSRPAEPEEILRLLRERYSYQGSVSSAQS